MSTISHYYLNGELTPVSETKIHVSDLGLLRGYGIFDFFLVKQSVPLFIENYLNRFFNSAAEAQLKIAFTKSEVHQQIQNLIAVNKVENGAIRLLLTGGYADDGITSSNPNFAILVHPFMSYPATVYANGTALILDQYQRFLPKVKTINYINSILQQSKMKAAGAVDVLYHEDGLLSETSRSNFFIVTTDQTIVTTPEGILQGITRMKTLEVAKSIFQVEERPVRLDELDSAAEAFITSSIKGVMPIVKIGESQIGDGKVGPVTRALIDAFAEFTEKYIQKKKASA